MARQTKKKKARPNRMAEEVREWVKTLAFAFLLFLVIRTFLVQSYRIPTGSMENTLLIWDFLLVNKVTYGAATPRRLPLLKKDIPYFRFPAFRDPHRGDIVVFEYPMDRTQDFVKRCVAAPGDTVEMRDKVLYVNQVPQNEPYVRHLDPRIIRSGEPGAESQQMEWQYRYLAPELKNVLQGGYSPTRDNFGPIVVPQGKYFCLGDNRDASLDSRYWGFVDRGLVKGSPMIIYFSWDRMSWLPRLGRIGRIIQ